jgi:tetratricopeptide (TPR) repeat protein
MNTATLRKLFKGLLIVGVCFSFGLAQNTVLQLRQQLRQDSGNISLWIQLGNAYLEAGDYNSAVESFSEAIALNYRSGDAHFGLGLAEFELGDYPAALFQFSEVARLHPERFDGHYNRAVTLSMLRRFDEAAEAFRDAIAQAEPEASTEEKIDAYMGLAVQLKRIGDFDAAADAYAEALELDPGNEELTFLKAQALFQAGRGLEALPDLTDLEASSTDYRVSALIADIYVQEDRIDHAVRSLQRALRNAQGTRDGQAQASILVNLGVLQRGLGRSEEAIASFQRAVAADNQSWQARYHLGVSYLEAGQTQVSLNYLEAAVNLNPSSGEAHLALASAYDRLGRSDEALGAADTALSRLSDPALRAQANFVKGRALYNRGDYSAALTAFESVLAEDSANAEAQLWTGLTEFNLENYASAVRYFERAVQLNPSSVAARINLGAGYLADSRYQDAELVYQMLAEELPQDAEVLFNLGWALYMQNRLEGARDAWLRSSDLGYVPARDVLRQYF